MIHQFFNFAEYPVDLFFILSGFILNWVYLPNNTSLNWSSYLRARVARILPLYYLTTFLTIPLVIYSFVRYGSAYMKGFTVHGYLIDFIQNLFLVSGIVDGFHHTFNGPAWSICVEFFCYLAVFPLLVYFKKVFSNKPYYLVPSLILVGVFTHNLVASYGMPRIPIGNWQWDSHWLLRGISGFVVGFCLCSIYQNHSNWIPNIWFVNLAVLVPISAMVLVGFDFLPGHAVLYVLPILVFFSAMDRGVAANLLKTKGIQWLGERSYSIYLWHSMLPGKLTGFLQNHLPSNVYFVVVVILILGVSELSYRFFECPCREYLRKFSFSSAKRNAVVSSVGERSTP